MSAAAYLPYAPIGALKPIGPDIWIVDGPEIRFGVLGLKLPFPTRMTVVRLADGGLWLHSPTAPDETLIAAIESLGPVRFLIAPNNLHYWWIPAWAARFPAAEIHAIPGLERSAKRPLPPARILGAVAPAGWADSVDQVLIEGSMLTEADFFHRASRTLILTDLIENFEPSRFSSRFYRLLARLGGAADPDGKAPYDMRMSFLGRHRAVRAAVERMIAWGPEKIVLAHGRWYERDAIAELRRAFRWVL